MNRQRPDPKPDERPKREKPCRNELLAEALSGGFSDCEQLEKVFDLLERAK